MIPESKIGIAAYTVHQSLQSNLHKTLCDLSGMGYQNIEFFGEPESFSIPSIQEALSDSGLSVTGWHLDWTKLHPSKIRDTILFLHRCGCDTAVVQCLGGRWSIGHTPAEECMDRWLYYADWLNGVNSALKREGIRLSYHNHDHEFSLRYEGKSVFELLYDRLSPDIVMELDTGNCIEGGGDPVKMLSRYRERSILLHLKPWSKTRGFQIVLGEADDANDWPDILHHPQARFDGILIESENTALPELENAARCLQNLQKYLLR